MAEKDEKPDVEEELIPVETPPKPAEEADGTEAAEEGEEEEDERLGADPEADVDGEASANAKRRKQRREHARLRRDQTRAELEQLRAQNAELLRRVGTVESHAIGVNEATIQERMTQALEDVRQAEEIFATATSEGKGEYALQAMRIRDAATVEANRLYALQQQMQQHRAAAEQQTQQPQVDPGVQRHAAEWMRDNPWYDPSGADEVSALTKQIDVQIAQEGHDPRQRTYWEELTKRVTAALNTGKGNGRSAPPMGNTREHAPPSTKRSEIYVTPERKAAMVEAGIWDDPVRRQRVLKEYREYDKASAR